MAEGHFELVDVLCRGCSLPFVDFEDVSADFLRPLHPFAIVIGHILAVANDGLAQVGGRSQRCSLILVRLREHGGRNVGRG